MCWTASVPASSRVQCFDDSLLLPLKRPLSACKHRVLSPAECPPQYDRRNARVGFARAACRNIGQVAGAAACNASAGAAALPDGARCIITCHVSACRSSARNRVPQYVAWVQLPALQRCYPCQLPRTRTSGSAEKSWGAVTRPVTLAPPMQQQTGAAERQRRQGRRFPNPPGVPTQTLTPPSPQRRRPWRPPLCRRRAAAVMSWMKTSATLWKRTQHVWQQRQRRMLRKQRKATGRHAA